MKTSVLQKITSWSAGILVLLCILAPFHAFLTVWAASIYGHYTVWRLWPEVLLVVLGMACAVLLIGDQKLRQAIFRSPLTWYLAAYVVLIMLLGIWALAAHRVAKTALADGFILDVRLPLFFFVAQIVAARTNVLQTKWRKIVLIPAAIVVLFGLLQIFVLPPNFLQHFGYGPQTIPAYETVDQNMDYVRAQSTLRGANPLGAYLVVVVAALAAVGFARRATWIKGALAIGFAAALALLGYTYSRSAYIGVVIALAALVWWSIKNERLKRTAMFGAVAVLILGALSFAVLRHNARFENTFFHTDQYSQSQESSNQERGSALESGIHDVLHEPFGEGPGTAGPASAHNTGHRVRIAENYYLQIGQETGWLGLVLFIAINIMIGVWLWKRHTPLVRVLLASLLGITLINMLSHAWTDDTLAILWWILAGGALAPILTTKVKKRVHETA